LVGWIIGALEGAVVMGGLGALGIALYGQGIPEESAARYERALKAGEFLVVVRGSASETARAKEILLHAGAESVDAHMLTGPLGGSVELQAEADLPFDGGVR
jgi:hypothetical protein